MSAALDTVDHLILLQRLLTSFGIDDRQRCTLVVLVIFIWPETMCTSWPYHYLSGMCRATGVSAGPIVFVLCAIDLMSLIESYRLSLDDTQVYGSCPVAAVDML